MSGLFGPEGTGPANASSDGVLNLTGSRDSALQVEMDEQVHKSHLGANWFFWIAGLSLVNSVVVLMNGRWSFLAALAITQFIDGLAAAISPRLGSVATVLALLLDLLTAGVIVVLGLMARQRHSWAFVLGLILYAADGLLLIIFHDWLGLAFHAYASYRIFGGLTANKRLTELQLEAGLKS